MVVRMKRPQGYKTIKCPSCKVKIKLVFRTMHRLKIEALEMSGDALPIEAEEGDYRG